MEVHQVDETGPSCQLRLRARDPELCVAVAGCHRALLGKDVVSGALRLLASRPGPQDPETTKPRVRAPVEALGVLKTLATPGEALQVRGEEQLWHMRATPVAPAEQGDSRVLS